MATSLEVTLSLTSPRILCGEALQIVSAVRNIGSQDALVHEGAFFSPLFYEIRLIEDGSLAQEISQAAYQSWHTNNEIPPPADDPQHALTPNQYLEIEEDLMAWALDPIFAGRYHIICHYAHPEGYFVSPPVYLEVASPNPTTYTVAYCPTEQVYCAALSHANSAKSSVLMDLETPGPVPGDGSFVRRHEFSPPAPRQLAIALQTEAAAEGRWLAWLQGDKFGAIQVWGDTICGDPAAVATNIPSARLVETGFQLPDESAIFLCYDPAGGSMQQTRCRTQNVETMARACPWTLPPTQVTLSYQREEAAHLLRLFWVEKDVDTTRIFTGHFNVDDATAQDNTVEVCRSTSPLAAWAVAPIPDDCPPHLHLLWGPNESDSLLLYQRIFVTDRGMEKEEWIIFPPTTTAEEYHIAPSLGDQLPVLAKSRGAFHWLDAASEGMRWQELVNFSSATNIQLSVTAPGDHWATWLTDDSGMQSSYVVGPRLSFDDQAEEEEEPDAPDDLDERDDGDDEPDFFLAEDEDLYDPDDDGLMPDDEPDGGLLEMADDLADEGSLADDDLTIMIDDDPA